mmetsp:Transcript_108917/g.274077  ORF Transcript_108917/g.274077 Transcript_108917/m.274077 type:complete len:382 (+) Transcript_108917:318-1463(+)
MDEFEMAIAEKNKVLEEMLQQIEQLRAENKQLVERMDSTSVGPSPSGSEIVSAAFTGTPAPPAEAPDQQQHQQQLVAEQQLRLQAEGVAQQASQAATEMQAQLMAAQEELAQLKEQVADPEAVVRARAENEELRSRLADAIAKADAAHRAAAALQAGADSGESVAAETEEAIALTLDTGENIGVVFGAREARGLGRGWPVVRLREGGWAQRSGIKEGDELHRANGQQIEVLPEDEVMDLLRQQPLQLEFVRRSGGPTALPSSPAAGDAAAATRVAELEAALVQRQRDWEAYAAHAAAVAQQAQAAAISRITELEAQLAQQPTSAQPEETTSAPVPEVHGTAADAADADALASGTWMSLATTSGSPLGCEVLSCTLSSLVCL